MPSQDAPGKEPTFLLKSEISSPGSLVFAPYSDFGGRESGVPGIEGVVMIVRVIMVIPPPLPPLHWLSPPQKSSEVWDPRGPLSLSR